MSVIDSIIAAFSPQKAYYREAFRQAYNELRNYDAGSYSRPNQNWRVDNQSAEMTDRFSRDDVRARARDLERNSDIMSALISAYKRNVVGGGYHIQAKSKDLELNKDIEKLWYKWCKKRNCDVTGSQNFTQILRMAVERKKIDGGILFVKRYTEDGLVPFKLQMIEVDELDISVAHPKTEGNKVVGGIEYNSFNKAEGYFIKKYSTDGYSINETIWIDAKDVIFYFSKKRPSQLREMSDLSPTIPRIRDANEFMTAVSVKQRIEACLSVFIKKSIPTVGTVGRSGDSGNPRVSYEGKTISPGMMKELNAGDEIQVVNPNGQATDASAFTKLHEHMIGAGQGISYEALTRDMSQSNYSSARQGIIEDDQTFNEEREQLVEILDEIYETFVISAVLAGKLTIKDFWTNKEDYLYHTWTREPKPWIDPQKEANANKIAIQTGQKTYKQLAAESGNDWKDQINDMAEVVEYAASKGIDINKMFYGYSIDTSEEDGREDKDE